MKITITGHRPQRLMGKEQDIKAWMTGTFQELNPELVITGMAQGVDQIAAWICYDEHIPYYCYFPYKRVLHPEQEFLLENSAGRTWMKEKYNGPQDFIERDKRMVEMGDMVLAVWDGKEYGGTWETMEYARKLQKDIIILNLETL